MEGPHIRDSPLLPLHSHRMEPLGQSRKGDIFGVKVCPVCHTAACATTQLDRLQFKMNCIYLLLLLLIVLLSIDVSSSSNVVSFKQNLDQVLKKWNCNKPQSRLVYLEDEYDEYNPSAIYLPHAAVLQRCGKSVGCCKNGQICSPSKTESIKFVFEQFLRGKKDKIKIDLINHLSCECQTVSVTGIIR